MLSLRSRPYVELARATKLSDLEIIFEELMPNLLPYIGVGMASASLGAIFALVGLEMIGLGPVRRARPRPDHLQRDQQGRAQPRRLADHSSRRSILSAAVPGVNLINFGLEEIYNPRLRAIAGA